MNFSLCERVWMGNPWMERLKKVLRGSEDQQEAAYNFLCPPTQTGPLLLHKYTSTNSNSNKYTSTQVHKHQLKLGPSSYTSTVNLNFAAQRKLNIKFNQTFDIILQIWKWKICAHQRPGILNHFLSVLLFSASKDGYGEGEVRIPKRGVLVSDWQYLVSGWQYLVKGWQCLILRMAMFGHGWQCLVRGMAMNEDCWVPASAIAIAWPLSFLRWSTLKSFTNSLQCRDFDDGNENGNDMRYFLSVDEDNIEKFLSDAFSKSQDSFVPSLKHMVSKDSALRVVSLFRFHKFQRIQYNSSLGSMHHDLSSWEIVTAKIKAWSLIFLWFVCFRHIYLKCTFDFFYIWVPVDCRPKRQQIYKKDQ